MTKVLVGFAVAGSIFCSSAFAVDAFNLSVFKGRYKGNVTLTGPGGTKSGRANVNFAGPRDGSTGRINFRAVFSDGITTDVLPTLITLSANRQVSVTDLLVGIAGTNNAKPGTGRRSQRKRTLRFNATNGEGITLRGTAVARDVANRRLLTLTLVSDDGGGANTFTAKLRAPLP